MNFAVIGENVQNSLSPRMHQWIYHSLNLEHRYDAIDVSGDLVDSIVDKLRKGILDGVNITIPFKTTFIDFLDKSNQLVSNIGAINCIHSKDGILRGYNTDYYGFERLIFSNGINLKNKKILLIGAGGASRAISVYLANNNIYFSIINRTLENAQSLVSETKCISYASIISDSILESKYNVIINTLPYSVNVSEILESLDYNFKSLDYYIDINYHINTQICTKIKADKIVNGLSMLIYQGIKSNEIWMEKKIEQQITYSKLYNFLSEDKC